MNLLYEFRKNDKMGGCAEHFIAFWAMSIIYLIIQELEFIIKVEINGGS